MDLLVDGVAGGEGGHVEVRSVTYLVKSEWHRGEVGMRYRCVCGGHSHGS